MSTAPASFAGDDRFFLRAGPHALAAVAAAADGVTDEAALARAPVFSGVAPLQAAGPSQVAFLDNRKYLDVLKTTRAGAVIVSPEARKHAPETAVAIVTDNPYLGFARVAALFHPEPPAAPGIHPSAIVDPTAYIDPAAEIGPLAVICARVKIGAGSRVDAGAVIGAGVVIGRDCRISTHVSVSHAILGDRVTLFPGARIGQEGFGFALGPAGFVTVPQLGRAIIEDDVEIGANSTVDRGATGDTVIGAGSRLDNLVMIGHNVRLGRCCVIVSQAGISGSTVLGDFVTVAGQAGLIGHLTIGEKARIGAQAGVMGDVPANKDVVGSPAVPVRDFFRQVAVVRKLAGTGRKAAGGGDTGSDAA